MGNLLHSLGTSAIVLAVVFAASFLYYWLCFLKPQNEGAQHFQAKRYTEAAKSFRTVLKRRPPASIEADTRRRLADTLDVLGQTEEASIEREKASAAAMKAVTDPMALTAQGDLLERQGRHDEACFCYEEALKVMPTMLGGGRALIMAKLALAHHPAGRSAETLRWAQLSLTNGPDKTVRPLMHRMAGVALSDLGDLDQAEVQHRLSLELMEKAGKPKEIAEGLVLLASLQKQRGHYEEAITTARRSREIARSPSRTDLAVEAECLRDMGRFDEARAVMRKHFDGPRFDQPHLERRMQALGSLGMAWIEARAEQPEAAWPHLEAARSGLNIPAYSSNPSLPPANLEEKLALWCDATTLNILAQQNRCQEARQLRERIELRLTNFAADTATLRGTYGHLARASLRLGDLAECRDYCHRYESSHPSPSILPTIHYLLGEFHLRLDEKGAAREEFTKAVTPGIDSLDARRAQVRLDEMEGSRA